MFLKHGHRGYLNPYLGGILLGLLLLFTFYITGRGLGASGAIKSTVVAVVHEVAPAHAENSEYLGKYISDDDSPLNAWLVFEILGVIAGGFLAGAIGGRLKLKVERGPHTKRNTRLLAALGGGVLFGIGAQFGKGCTSGAALTGSAAQGTSGFIVMIFIFGTAYLVAYFVRKLWL
jgi:uncharacterized membrane protein YedE/YeeE